ncbi:MAG: GNAT family N-acetyltransferase [Chloroflexi bacterium]|nr:GNAT family N-acetyltransferase [Chloroflexota bacterium]
MARHDDPSEWNPPRIEGRLIELRRHAPENLATVLRWYADPEVARLTRYSLRPMPPEEVERFFQSRLLASGSVAYGIHERRTGRLIGLTTFSALDPDNGSVLFHITIGEHDAWGRGYGTDAARLMLWLAFERIGLHRVGLSVFAFNERAIRSYQKVGFRIEGRLREAIRREDGYWDELQMGILRPEWPGLETSWAAASESEERKSGA